MNHEGERKPIYSRVISASTVFLIFSILVGLLTGVLSSHWEHSHEHERQLHLDQYHERFDEAAIRNEDERRYHQEEYAEYATRYAETSREHDHDHYEAMRRNEEQFHERHETSRENHWNSRTQIPTGAKHQVLDERTARTFLRKWRPTPSF